MIENMDHGLKLSVDLKCFLTGGDVAATSRTEYWYCELPWMATLFTSCEILFYNPYWYCISILHILCWYFDIPYWYCKSPAGGHLIHIMWDSLLWGERQAGYSYAHTPNRGYALNDYYQQLLFPPIKGILSWINDIATIWIYIQSKKIRNTRYL